MKRGPNLYPYGIKSFCCTKGSFCITDDITHWFCIFLLSGILLYCSMKIDVVASQYIFTVIRLVLVINWIKERGDVYKKKSIFLPCSVDEDDHLQSADLLHWSYTLWTLSSSNHH